MKAGNCTMWRPFAGVTVVSALAIAVSAWGGPRDGSLRPERGAKADTSRLVSGPADTIRSSVAGGGATAVIQLTPKVNSEAGAYGHGGFYSAADISGQRLTVASGPGRTFWNMEVHSWGSLVDLRSYQGRVSSMGLLGAMADCGGGAGSCVGAGDLTPASQACASPLDCNTSFNDGNSPCAGGVCEFAFVASQRNDWVFSIANGVFGGTQKGCGLNDPAGPLCFGATDVLAESVADDGVTVHYAATFVYDVPSDAKGIYSLSWVLPEVDTFLGDNGQPSLNIPLAAAVGGELEVIVGACCTSLGTGACTDGVSEAECNQLPTSNARVFTPGEVCPQNGGPDCPSCTSDADCNDGDLCTDDSCNVSLFVCVNTPIAGWNQATQCCDADTGDICTPVDANTCSNASCSLPDNRGTCIQTPVGEGNPCNAPGDDNPCTFDDTCQADESCTGTDVNGEQIVCSSDQDCQGATGLTAPVCISGLCECSLVPDLTIRIDAGEKADPLCFAAGEKVTATVNVAAATAPVNGGQFLINYDPSCLSLNSVSGVDPYNDIVFGPVIDETAGTIFVVVGVGFGAGDGPAGNADMVSMSFTKSGANACDSCNICFDSNNPQNTFLVDNTGQRIGVNPICSDNVVANNVVTIDVPDNIKTNVDCNQPDAVETWEAPSASDSCGNSTLTCVMQHQSETTASPAPATGGTFLIGATNFCCSAESDWCGKTAGSPGSPATAASDTGGEGCWTVEVNDQTSLDITIGLSPSTAGKPADGVTRCIKFTLYPNTIQEPLRFSEDIQFGAEDIIGKSKDSLKIPGHNNWDCITAWDQLHTLRSCFLFGPDSCVDGGLSASFRGDPAFGGNWLIGGNLDGWKKDVAGAEPSLFVIDVLDYGTFVAEFGKDYGTGDTPCGTQGPHGDIDGDGLVTTDDYAFISMNFLATAKVCCGVDGLPAGSDAGITSISVEQLRRQGDGHLAVADLNGDGVVDVGDMNAFMQGARPSLKDGSVRKGSR